MDPESSTEARRRKRKSRGRGLRKTTGCLTCRRRHLKCDEATPSCGPCVKSSQNCSYVATRTERSPIPTTPSIAPQLRSTLPNSEGEHLETVVQPQSPHRTATPPSADTEFASWDSSFPDYDRTQAASGLLHLNSGGPSYPPPYNASEVLSSQPAIPYSHSSIADANEATVSSAATPPDAAFFRWLGLLASDAVQEDNGISRFGRPLGSGPDQTTGVQTLSLVSPRQSSSSSIGISTHPPQRLSNAGHSGAASAELIQAPSSKRHSWQGSEPAKLLDHEHIVFENFVRNVSHWIDLFDPTGCFSNFVPHLAMHDAGLMSALLALSSRHLSISPGAKEEHRDRNIGLQYYYETLHYLQKAMHFESYTVSLELLATALIVSTYEMLDDSGSGWERHLKGVFWIQRSQVIHGESEGLKQAVWWAWLRQDVWAAFREQRKTLSFWKPTRAYNIMAPYEIASRSVWLFAKAVDYCSKEEIEASESNIQARIERADTIFDMLDEWRSHLTINFTPLPLKRENSPGVFEPLWIHPPAFGVSVQLHFSARILLLLNRPSMGGMRGYMEQQRLLANAVDTICGIAKTLTDDASSLMSSQCLYIAGLCVQETRQREAVLALIDSCHQQTGWPTRSLSENLKSEWQKSDFR